MFSQLFNRSGQPEEEEEGPQKGSESSTTCTWDSGTPFVAHRCESPWRGKRLARPVRAAAPPKARLLLAPCAAERARGAPGRDDAIHRDVPAMWRDRQTAPPLPDLRRDGFVRAPETFEVRIPPGVDTGSRVRVPGKGNAAPAAAPRATCTLLRKLKPSHL